MVMESARREKGRKPSMPSVRCVQRATERETLERRASAKSAFDGLCGLLSRCAPSRACVLLAVVYSMGAGAEGWLLRAWLLLRCVRTGSLRARALARGTSSAAPLAELAVSRRGG